MCIISWRFWEPRRVRYLRMSPLYSVMTRSFSSWVTLMPIFQHTRRNVLNKLRGNKIETCREYLNNSEHGFEEVRMIQRVRYFVKSKKDNVYKTEKNISASKNNFMDYTLFIITWILRRIKPFERKPERQWKRGVQIQVSGMLRIPNRETEIIKM